MQYDSALPSVQSDERPRVRHRRAPECLARSRVTPTLCLCLPKAMLQSPLREVSLGILENDRVPAELE